MTQVKFEGLKKSFGKVEVLHGIDLEIQDDEFIVFVGPSGCGKSTLLRLLAGLEDITSGNIYIDGIHVNTLPPAKRGIAMVFQSYALYPHMTVYNNIGFGLKRSKYPKAEIDKRVREAAKILQVDHLFDRKPKELSGGQRQRVAIGRAIVREPKVFLFDEPLSNLDASLRVQMRVELAKLKAQLKTTMVYVTHDQVEAMTLADRIVVMRSGKIEQVGTPLEIYHHPSNLFVAGFIGSPQMNFLAGQVTEVTKDTLKIKLPGEPEFYLPIKASLQSFTPEVGDSVTLGIRPEHIIDGNQGEIKLSGTLSVIERLGGESHLYVRLPDGQTVLITTPGDRPAQIGELVNFSIKGSTCHLFNADESAFKRDTGFPHL